MVVSGVKIGDYHCYNDLGCWMQEKRIEAPEVITHAITVPGRDGQIDLTRYLRGRCVYGMRNIYIKLVADGGEARYATLQEDLFNVWHGRKLPIVFDDDNKYEYMGSVSVGPVTLEGDALYCELNIVAEPYKLSLMNNGGLVGDIRITANLNDTTTHSNRVQNLNGNTLYSVRVSNVSTVTDSYAKINAEFTGEEGQQKIKNIATVYRDRPNDFGGQLVMSTAAGVVNYKIKIKECNANNTTLSFWFREARL